MTPDAPTGACVTLAGTWGIAGTCGADLCVIQQVGCAITELDCSSGARSTSGSITGSEFTYTGVSGGGTPATCTGTLAGDSIAGTCNLANLGTCSFSGDRR